MTDGEPASAGDAEFYWLLGTEADRWTEMVRGTRRSRVAAELDGNYVVDGKLMLDIEVAQEGGQAEVFSLDLMRVLDIEITDDPNRGEYIEAIARLLESYASRVRLRWAEEAVS